MLPFQPEPLNLSDAFCILHSAFQILHLEESRAFNAGSELALAPLMLISRCQLKKQYGKRNESGLAHSLAFSSRTSRQSHALPALPSTLLFDHLSRKSLSLFLCHKKMNTHDDSAMSVDEASAPPDAPTAADIPARPKWYWTRRLLAGNPFYLISAALLLFGINRLSIDPNFLGAELPNLVFNFSAMQLYEVLLVLVAIILARRRIWYDSMLLLGLENMLVLVPFILVTQALLIGNGVASALCLAGTLLAAMRFASLRRFSTS